MDRQVKLCNAVTIEGRYAMCLWKLIVRGEGMRRRTPS